MLIRFLHILQQEVLAPFFSEPSLLHLLLVKDNFFRDTNLVHVFSYLWFTFKADCNAETILALAQLSVFAPLAGLIELVPIQVIEESFLLNVFVSFAKSKQVRFILLFLLVHERKAVFSMEALAVQNLTPPSLEIKNAVFLVHVFLVEFLVACVARSLLGFFFSAVVMLDCFSLMLNSFSSARPRLDDHFEYTTALHQLTLFPYAASARRSKISRVTLSVTFRSVLFQKKRSLPFFLARELLTQQKPVATLSRRNRLV